jgi:hypothetical protein
MREVESLRVGKCNPRIILCRFISTTAVSLGKTVSLLADSIACFFD